MDNLKEIKATPKTGKESLSYYGHNTDYNLLDFWRWSVSDILSNATRGRFAEFIVGTAIGLKPDNLRDEWDAYDLITDYGAKIEVKSAAYIQSWKQKKLSTISFSIKPARAWDNSSGVQRGKPKRHADIYIFCHLKHKDQATINPLKMEQWDFYILPTFKLDNYKLSKNTIGINSLKKLTGAVSYTELSRNIERVYKEQKSYTQCKKALTEH